MGRFRNPEKIGKILEQVLFNLKIKRKIKEGMASCVWKEVVGKKIAAHTQAIRVKRGKLFVNVNDSSWLQEISFLKEKITEKINKRMREDIIKEIYFKIGEVK